MAKTIRRLLWGAYFCLLKFKMLAAVVHRLIKRYSAFSQKELADLRVNLVEAEIEMHCATAEGSFDAELKFNNIKAEIDKKQALLDFRVQIRSYYYKAPYVGSSVDMAAKKAAAKILLSIWPLWAFIGAAKQKIISRYANEKMPEKAFGSKVIKQLSEIIYIELVEENLKYANAQVNKSSFPNITFEERDDIVSQVRANILSSAGLEDYSPKEISEVLEGARNQYKIDNKGYLLKHSRKIYLNELCQAKKLLNRAIIISQKDDCIGKSADIIYDEKSPWYSKISAGINILWARITKPMFFDRDTLLLTLKRIGLMDDYNNMTVSCHFVDNIQIVDDRIKSLGSADIFVSGKSRSKVLGELKYFVGYGCKNPSKSYGLNLAELGCCKEILEEDLAIDIEESLLSSKFSFDDSCGLYSEWNKIDVKNNQHVKNFCIKLEVQENYLRSCCENSIINVGNSSEIPWDEKVEMENPDMKFSEKQDIKHIESKQAYKNFLAASKEMPFKDTPKYWETQAKLRISMAESLLANESYNYAYICIMAAIYTLSMKCSAPDSEIAICALHCREKIEQKINAEMVIDSSIWKDWLELVNIFPYREGALDSYGYELSSHKKLYDLTGMFSSYLSEKTRRWFDGAVVTDLFRGDIVAQYNVSDKIESYQKAGVLCAGGAAVGAIGGPIGAGVGAFPGVAALAAVYLMPARHYKDKATKQLESIIAKAKGCYERSDFIGFFDALSKKYADFSGNIDPSNIGEESSLIDFSRCDEGVAIKFYARDIICKLLKHKFRPDDVACILYFLGKALFNTELKFIDSSYLSGAHSVLCAITDENICNDLLTQASRLDEKNGANSGVTIRLKKVIRMALVDVTMRFIIGFNMDSFIVARDYFSQLKKLQHELNRVSFNNDDIKELEYFFQLFNEHPNQSQGCIAAFPNSSIPGLVAGKLSNGNSIDFILDLTASKEKLLDDLYAGMTVSSLDYEEQLVNSLENALIAGEFNFSDSVLREKWASLNKSRIMNVDALSDGICIASGSTANNHGISTYDELIDFWEAKKESEEVEKDFSKILELFKSCQSSEIKTKNKIKFFCKGESVQKEYLSCMSDALQLRAKALSKQLYVWHYMPPTNSLSLAYIDKESAGLEEIHVARNALDNNFMLLTVLPSLENADILFGKLHDGGSIDFRINTSLSDVVFNMLSVKIKELIAGSKGGHVKKGLSLDIEKSLTSGGFNVSEVLGNRWSNLKDELREIEERLNSNVDEYISEGEKDNPLLDKYVEAIRICEGAGLEDRENVQKRCLENSKFNYDTKADEIRSFYENSEVEDEYLQSLSKGCERNTLQLGARALSKRLHIWGYDPSDRYLSLGYIDESSEFTAAIHIAENKPGNGYTILTETSDFLSRRNADAEDVPIEFEKSTLSVKVSSNSNAFFAHGGGGGGHVESCKNKSMLAGCLPNS